MVFHAFSQCNYCKTNILLRFQMGYFDIPFDICCPECGVHICGVQKIVDDHTLTINNASIIEEDLDGLDYYADFSVELPHAKTNRFESIESLMKTNFSPFMLTASLYEGDKYFELVKKMGEFLSFRTSCWSRLTPLYDLFFNGKIALTQEHFLKFSSRFVVKNDIDALMALHQTTVLGMNTILPDGTLGKFIDASKQISTQSVLLKMDDLITSLGGEEYFNSVSKRLVRIYDRWIVNFEKYIPATMLSLGNAVEKLDKDTFGIATTSFEDMIKFYADSYELILDYIDVAIGLNNIVVRGEHNTFPTNTIRVNKKTPCVGSFEDYREIVKSSRLNLFVDNEPFSKAIPLNRKVRNAIAHFSYEFNAGTQKITFSDKFKSNDNTVELYLVELALLCYENISILVYLDELLYTLRKIHYGNVKKCAVGKYPKSEKLGSAGQAACCACTHSRYFTGGSPSGLRV